MPPSAAGLSAALVEPPLLHSRDLFRRGNVVRIEHQGQIYLLRLTREHKLILNK
jgi:hemin uptake protein HemP